MTIDASVLPLATVVVPAKNEARFIGRCLQSLRQQSYPPGRMRLIVVDNGSTDETVSVARRFGAEVVSAPGVLVGAVRNRGAQLARDGLVAFIDGDCVAGPDWLLTAARELALGEVGVAGGGCVPNPEGTWVERAWASSEPATRRDVDALPGGSMVFRKSEFDTLNGFSESISAGEDDDICSRVRKSGKRVISTPGCYVTHLGYPEKLIGVFRRQIWHGSNQLDVTEAGFDVQLFFTHMFALGIAAVLLAIITWSRALLEGGLLLQLTPALAFMLGKMRRRKPQILLALQLLAIAWFFYLGRSFGLLRNYARRTLR